MCNEVSSGKELAERLLMKKRNVFEESDAGRIQTMFSYAEGYKHFLDVAKTEREAVTELIAMAEKVTPTAPEAEVPSWLTKNVSAML